MIPLIPSLVLAFLSFLSSAFVILRIVIPILPPHPLSRRVSPVSPPILISPSYLNHHRLSSVCPTSVHFLRRSKGQLTGIVFFDSSLISIHLVTSGFMCSTSPVSAFLYGRSSPNLLVGRLATEARQIPSLPSDSGLQSLSDPHVFLSSPSSPCSMFVWRGPCRLAPSTG